MSFSPAELTAVLHAQMPSHMLDLCQILGLLCNPHVLPPAELMAVLRVAVETRKTQLVDAALDCIQKLISHSILTGPVHSINHKREAAGKVAGGRRRPTEDMDDIEGSVSGVMPPQVSCSPHTRPGFHIWCDPAADKASAFC